MIFIKAEWRFLLFGFLLAFFSSPGQTFFISLFSGIIRDELELSHGDFGTIYAIGTIASAVTLIPLGRLVDTIKLRTIALAIISGLAFAALHFSTIGSLMTLVIGIYLLRLSGQGMMTHLYATAITRRYEAERGRALSVAIFGHPASEFLMPIFVFTLLMIMPWRQVWQVTFLLVIVVMIPAALFLSGRSQGQDGGGVNSLPTGRDGTHWTRGQVLHDIRFWMLSGLVLAPSFTATGLFFHQIYFVETKGIPLAQWIAGYAFFSTSAIIGSLAGGYLVDKLTAQRIAPIAVSAFSIATAILYMAGPGNIIFIYFTIFGVVQGMTHSTINPIWAEIYGTRHLGAIRAIAQSMTVFASALSPVILGLMIDAGWSLLPLLLVLGSFPVAAGILSYTAVRMSPKRVT
jgi:sugar phosphate permease